MVKLKRHILLLGLVCMAPVNAVLGDSLFDVQYYRPVASDHRAYKAGDNLTVLIVETAVAATSANTSTNRATDMSGELAGNSAFNFGNVDLDNNFTGGGSIERSGKLAAQITVTVEAVLPNGDLYIKGEQVVEVNDEKQRIAIEGRVRPVDIAVNNTVLSTRVNDSKVSYVGKGILGQSQKPGLFTRFFTWLGLL